MTAIRVYVDEISTDILGSVVEYLNSHKDIVATMVSRDELFIAATGLCSLSYAECVVRNRINTDVSLQYVK